MPSCQHMQYREDPLLGNYKNTNTGRQSVVYPVLNEYIFTSKYFTAHIWKHHLLSVRALWLKWRMSWWRGSGWTSACSSSSSSTTVIWLFCRKSHWSYKHCTSHNLLITSFLSNSVWPQTSKCVHFLTIIRGLIL